MDDLVELLFPATECKTRYFETITNTTSTLLYLKAHECLSVGRWWHGWNGEVGRQSQGLAGLEHEKSVTWLHVGVVVQSRSDHTHHRVIANHCDVSFAIVVSECVEVQPIKTRCGWGKGTSSWLECTAHVDWHILKDDWRLSRRRSATVGLEGDIRYCYPVESTHTLSVWSENFNLPCMR